MGYTVQYRDVEDGLVLPSFIEVQVSFDHYRNGAKLHKVYRAVGHRSNLRSILY